MKPQRDEIIVFVYTGDRKYAGTKNAVHIILHGDHGTSSRPITLKNFIFDSFDRGQINTFRLLEESDSGKKNTNKLTKIKRLELWKDRSFGLISDDWFVEKIVVEVCAINETFVFPLFRWIKSGFHYQFKHLDTSLPQFDEFPSQRELELEEKKKKYQFDQKIPDGPVQIKSLPSDEQFSSEYEWGIAKMKARLKTVSRISKMFPAKWTCLEDINSIYSKTFVTPKGTDRWDSDVSFGRQRMTGINPAIISLLTHVPAKFPVSDDLVSSLIEGLTIQDAMEQKRLFLCDLKILEDIPTRPGTTLCHPFALFFIDKTQVLRPIAIQLFQEPGPNNPIFTPLDDPMLWKYVKMWYNNADCSYHQALAHLGLTHLLMEGIAIATNRTLSPSHPIFKILAPHFMYIIAINTRALNILITPGGWVDKTMAIQARGLLALCAKGFDKWRMDVEGLLPEDLKARGLDDPSTLPGYHYRDDAMMVFGAINKYVTSYVNLYYTSPELLEGDAEIQAWAQELVKERKETYGGLGLKGVPGNGSLHSTEDLANIITCIIFTCSVAHASANFGQYDEYGFPPNYPSFLKGKPPSSKDANVSESEILDSLPDQSITLDILIVTKILSSKGTKSLGDFEVQYIFDPNAMEIVDEFREDLKEINQKIKSRNARVPRPYDYLLPESIPNSISI